MTPLCDNRIGKKLRHISRRDFWFQAGMGLGGLALIDLLNRDGLLAAPPPATGGGCLGSAGVTDSPYLPKKPHFKPPPNQAIHLFMTGGSSPATTLHYNPHPPTHH